MAAFVFPGTELACQAGDLSISLSIRYGLPMNLSTTDLQTLYKSREVSRLTTFADVARQLRADDIAKQYAEARRSAPRRHDRGKEYFVEHKGQDKRSDSSNRIEEHLALALLDATEEGAAMSWSSSRTLEILDIQVPLKSRRDDRGFGRVDLIGLLDELRIAVIELKVRPATQGHGDTPLCAYLEALAYCAVVEANIAELSGEASAKFGKAIGTVQPALVVLAPRDYWNGYIDHKKAGDWWSALLELSTEVDEMLGLETLFLGLDDAEVNMGNSGRGPRLIKDCSIFEVAELIGN
jgi:hypothetical protein